METDVKRDGQDLPIAESSTALNDQNAESDSIAAFMDEVSSTEDVKIPSETEDSKSEAEQEEAPPVEEEPDLNLSEKSSKRFQQLANEKRQYKTLWEKDREELARLRERMANSQNLPINEQLRQEVVALKLDAIETKEAMKWEKAIAKHPELETDRVLQDLVYSQYVARKDYEKDITPESIATDIISALDKRAEKIKAKAYTEAEVNIAKQIKTQISPTGKKPEKGNDDWDSLLERAAQGDKEAELALFR